MEVDEATEWLLCTVHCYAESGTTAELCDTTFIKVMVAPASPEYDVFISSRNSNDVRRFDAQTGELLQIIGSGRMGAP